MLVRHESAEALGAIGLPTSLEVLEKYKDSPEAEISETCKIAIDLIKWKMDQNDKNQDTRTEFLSVDPAPALSSNEKSISQLKDQLMNENESLFNRYRAMFTLRNINSDDSALALVEGLSEPKSALFRHEVC